jgi:hypothetical protein
MFPGSFLQNRFHLGDVCKIFRFIIKSKNRKAFSDQKFNSLKVGNDRKKIVPITGINCGKKREYNLE